MTNLEFYRKCKTRYPPVDKFSRIEWWQIVLIFIGAVLIEPLFVYRKVSNTPLTRSFYFGQIKYFVLLTIPFFALYLWTSWKDAVKRHRGYCWLGKFEVVKKQSSLLFCYLWLAPGKGNKLKVNRSFFDKVQEGDVVVIRRDALGKIERLMRVKDIALRLKHLSSRRRDRP